MTYLGFFLGEEGESVIEIQPYSASHQVLSPRIWPDKGLGGEKLTGLAIPNGLVCLTL